MHRAGGAGGAGAGHLPPQCPLTSVNHCRREHPNGGAAESWGPPLHRNLSSFSVSCFSFQSTRRTLGSRELARLPAREGHPAQPRRHSPLPTLGRQRCSQEQKSGGQREGSMRVLRPTPASVLAGKRAGTPPFLPRESRSLLAERTWREPGTRHVDTTPSMPTASVRLQEKWPRRTHPRLRQESPSRCPADSEASEQVTGLSSQEDTVPGRR